MASLGEIRLNIDGFFTSTRASLCFAETCRFNNANNPVRKDAGPTCQLKSIELGERGECRSFELRADAQPETGPS